MAKEPDRYVSTIAIAAKAERILVTPLFVVIEEAGEAASTPTRCRRSVSSRMSFSIGDKSPKKLDHDYVTHHLIYINAVRRCFGQAPCASRWMAEGFRAPVPRGKLTTC
jgi:hypothetical protein